jgi:hypothetical protein
MPGSFDKLRTNGKGFETIGEDPVHAEALEAFRTFSEDHSTHGGVT